MIPDSVLLADGYDPARVALVEAWFAAIRAPAVAHLALLERERAERSARCIPTGYGPVFVMRVPRLPESEPPCAT